MNINLHNRKFRSIHNAENGEVSDETVFHYYQDKNIVSATYQGGRILQGQLIGIQFPDDHLEFAYQHVNEDQEILTGFCKSYPSMNEDGKIILNEFWQWTCKDHSEGHSTLMEIP